MEKEETGQRQSGIFNYFEGATIYNLVINGNMNKSGKDYFNHKEKEQKFTDEQIASALAAINGKENVISDYQKWLGACCLLSWKYGFPKNLQQCCEKIINLPYENGKLEMECKYESVRKFANYAFVKEDARNWNTYKPNETERNLFYTCYDVAQELDKAIQTTIE